MKCGVTVADFWEMTPYEATMTIEAAIWRDERAQKQALSTAWYTAALQRQKRIPSLKKLLSSRFNVARRLSREQLAKKQQDFEEMTAGVDVDILSERLARKQLARRQKKS